MDAKVGACGWMDTSDMGARILDTGLIRAAGVTPANAPEASVTEAISEDLERQGACLRVTAHRPGQVSAAIWCVSATRNGRVYCKAWPVRESQRFHKQAFAAGLWNGRSSGVRLPRKCPLCPVAL